jgi:uncharacterized membrane protein YbhN (UPF0104 family)
LFDRAVGLWGIIWLVALAGAWFWLRDDPNLRDNAGLRSIVVGAWVVVAVTLGGWLMLGLLSDRRAHRFAGRLGLIPKVGHVLAECWRAIWLYRRRGRAVLLALVLSLGTHTATVLMFHFAAHAFVSAADSARLPSLAEHCLVVPVGMAIQAIPLAPGGVGIGEATFENLYKLLGRPKQLGVRASLVQRALTWILGLVGYLVFLRLRAPVSSAKLQHATVGTE